MLIDRGVPLRPDWENVITPVVDYLLARPEADPARIVLTGLSLGGYLAPRAATAEHRLAACIFRLRPLRHVRPGAQPRLAGRARSAAPRAAASRSVRKARSASLAVSARACW
jgi:hypothetical protein